MNFLVVGLGSMGKRRIRCLQSLGYQNNKISGFDFKKERREEVEAKYGVNTYSSFNEAISSCSPEMLIISVPPDHHHTYMKEALKQNMHAFIEASVLDTDLEEIIKLEESSKIKLLPSVTMAFHSGVRIIKDLIDSGKLGKIYYFNHRCSSYLPDWHPYESVSDYYVSKKETGGCREIVAFELGWISYLFGNPNNVAATVKNVANIKGAENIDDIYMLLINYPKVSGMLTVDVVSKNANRVCIIQGEKGEVLWDWSEHKVKFINHEIKKTELIEYNAGNAEEGYDTNIGEKMYIDELKSAIETAKGNEEFINTLKKDHIILKSVYASEKFMEENKFINI